MFLIEALIAILIFSLGILGMMAMGGAAVSAQSDAQYRTDASNLADAIASEIALNVNRASDATIATALAAFSHNESGAVDSCAFSGTSVSNATTAGAKILSLINKAYSADGLPGATNARQQILVETGVFNRVTITLCWKAPSDNAFRRHTLVTYVN